jgi:hypothetical protein
MSNKEPIVHFRGKDMPAGEFLKLICERDPDHGAAILVWCAGEKNYYAANTVQGYRRLLRRGFPDLTDEQIEDKVGVKADD